MMGVTTLSHPQDLFILRERGLYGMDILGGKILGTILEFYLP